MERCEEILWPCQVRAEISELPPPCPQHFSPVPRDPRALSRPQGDCDRVTGACWEPPGGTGIWASADGFSYSELSTFLHTSDFTIIESTFKRWRTLLLMCNNLQSVWLLKP